MLTMCFSYAFTQDGIPIVRQIDSSDEKYKPWEYEHWKSFYLERATQTEKALLQKTEQEGPFLEIRCCFRFDTIGLAASNAIKQEIYNAYLKKTPITIKASKREQVGMEGQYTKTYFIIDSGKIKIIEAYYGHVTGRKGLQYVHKYTPEKIEFGYLDLKQLKLIPTPIENNIPPNEFFIGYSVPGDEKIKIF